MSFAYFKSPRALCCPVNKTPSKASLVPAYLSNLFLLPLFPMLTPPWPALDTSIIKNWVGCRHPLQITECSLLVEWQTPSLPFPSLTAWIRCHLLYKSFPASSGIFNCFPFGSLTVCVSLHYWFSCNYFFNHLPSPLDSEFTKGRNPVLFIFEFLLPPVGNISY